MMAYLNEQVVEILIPNELGYEKTAMAIAATTAEKMGFSRDRVDDLKTAVGEACTNAIAYGNSFNTQTQVSVILATDNNRISVRVIDEGRKPIPEPLPDQCNRTDPQSIGLYLMSKLTDEISIRSQPGRNEVTMTNYLLTPAHRYLR